MTGQDISNLFDQQVDKDYTGYLDNTRKNRLFRKVLFDVIELKYRQLAPQKQFDELTKLIKVDQPFAATSNAITLSSAVPDYMHLLTAKCTFTDTLSVTITDISATNPMVVTVSGDNNIRTGESLTISGVTATGNITNANATSVVTKLTDTTFSIPISGTGGTYISGGAIARTYANYAKIYFSDQKISAFSTPTVSNPKIMLTQGTVKAYPTNKTCSTITIDYITKPPVFIDVADNAIDLTTTYPEKLLQFVVDYACKNYSMYLRDSELMGMSNQEIINNP